MRRIFLLALLPLLSACAEVQIATEDERAAVPQAAQPAALMQQSTSAPSAVFNQGSWACSPAGAGMRSHCR
jgi:hypothetical protein